jgi:hypothetical protein
MRQYRAFPRYSHSRTSISVLVFGVFVATLFVSEAYGSGSQGGTNDRLTVNDPDTVTLRRASILRQEFARYKSVHGRRPSQLEELLRLPATDAFTAPQKRWLTDGWGQSFRLECTGKPSSCRLRSAGPDRKLNTLDDRLFPM